MREANRKKLKTAPRKKKERSLGSQWRSLKVHALELYCTSKKVNLDLLAIKAFFIGIVGQVLLIFYTKYKIIGLMFNKYNSGHIKFSSSLVYLP
jgi:hypothetical protein